MFIAGCRLAEASQKLKLQKRFGREATDRNQSNLEESVWQIEFDELQKRLMDFKSSLESPSLRR